MRWNCHLYYLWEGTNSSYSGRNSTSQSLQCAVSTHAAHQQVLCLIGFLPLTCLVRCMCWKTFLGTPNDKYISFAVTPSVICVFFSPFSPQKKKRDFTLADSFCVTPASVSPGAITRLLLSTLCLCGKQFRRMMDLSSLFANIFQFIVPVYSSTKYIVLQIRMRETVSILRLCHGGFLLHWNEFCMKGTFGGCFILAETGCYRMVYNNLVHKAKNLCSWKQGKL